MINRFSNNMSLSRNKLALFILLLFIFLSGIVPQSVLIYFELPIIIYLAWTDEGYLIFPIMIFYYNQLGLFMGISVYRLYSLIFISSLLLKRQLVIKKNTSTFAILIVFLIYEVLIMLRKSPQIAFFSFIDLLSVCLLVTKCLNDSIKLKKFFKIFVVVAVLAIITGLIVGNSAEVAWANSNTVINLSRFQATFEDPNYMGYFYNVAIFSVIILKPFKKIINIVLVLIFTVVILSTSSVTAIIGNIVFWLVYLVIMKKVSFKVCIILVCLVLISVFLYNYGLNNFETPIIGQLSFRINEKLSALFLKKWDTVTTNRSSLLELHKEIYTKQNIFKQLFGGNIVSTYLVDLTGTVSVAHNDYIDTLLNVGLIGGSVLFFACIYQTVIHIISFKRTRDEFFIFKFLHKCIWFYYLTTLTVFLDFRFMIGLFI